MMPFTACASTLRLSSYRYTGKERDSESGLDYFGARYYASNMGRWMSPDWSAQPMPIAFADVEDPQSLNLYSYVRNNPTRFLDVFGHQKCPDGSTADSCVVATPEPDIDPNGPRVDLLTRAMLSRPGKFINSFNPFSKLFNHIAEVRSQEMRIRDDQMIRKMNYDLLLMYGTSLSSSQQQVCVDNILRAEKDLDDAAVPTAQSLLSLISQIPGSAGTSTATEAAMGKGAKVSGDVVKQLIPLLSPNSTNAPRQH